MDAKVAPRAGAWIEVGADGRARGLFAVAPRAGAWIEVAVGGDGAGPEGVAPRAGAWIEVLLKLYCRLSAWSLPVRERGLKCAMALVGRAVALVAPRAGAWIEVHQN